MESVAKRIDSPYPFLPAPAITQNQADLDKIVFRNRGGSSSSDDSQSSAYSSGQDAAVSDVSSSVTTPRESHKNDNSNGLSRSAKAKNPLPPPDIPDAEYEKDMGFWDEAFDRYKVPDRVFSVPVHRPYPNEQDPDNYEMEHYDNPTAGLDSVDMHVSDDTTDFTVGDPEVEEKASGSKGKEAVDLGGNRADIELERSSTNGKEVDAENPLEGGNVKGDGKAADVRSDWDKTTGDGKAVRAKSVFDRQNGQDTQTSRHASDPDEAPETLARSGTYCSLM